MSIPQMLQGNVITQWITTPTTTFPRMVISIFE